MSEVWINDHTGTHALTVISPNRWEGGGHCLIGPFSDQSVAAYFADIAVTDRQLDTVVERVFAHRDSWYVEVTALAEALTHSDMVRVSAPGSKELPKVRAEDTARTKPKPLGAMTHV
jgi:hypothetical protein